VLFHNKPPLLVIDSLCRKSILQKEIIPIRPPISYKKNRPHPLLVKGLELIPSRRQSHQPAIAAAKRKFLRLFSAEKSIHF